MPKDLRSYLAQLEQSAPQEIVHVQRPIGTRFDITALQVKLEKEGKYPVIVCDEPVNAGSGRPAGHRVVTNLLADRRRCAEAIGVSPVRVAPELLAKANRRIPPQLVPAKEAPVKQIIRKGDAVDLRAFPALWHHALDPGPYITAGFVTTTEPETGIHNCSLQRCWVREPAATGVFPATGSHNWTNIMRWWASGRDAPVAVWLGHHPAAYLGGQTYGRLAYPEDHYPSIGGLLDEPLRVVPTETFGSGLLVPADAEVVIEGVIPKDRWEAEGPFGERPGYTGGQRPNPVILVQAVTCRRDAYWQDILVGHRDNFIAGGFGTECHVYDRVKRAVPDVINVHAPPSAGCRDHVYIQVRKRRPGVGREAAAAALSCNPKHAFVFDEDIDIFDEREVLWAISTRTQWDRDLIVVPGLRAHALDPSVSVHGVGAKAALDCTMPAPPEPGLPQFYTPVNRVPEEALARVRLEDYVSAEALGAIPVR